IVYLFGGEVVHGDGILEERIVSRHHGDSAFGHEVTLAVGVAVVADGRAFGDMDIAVNDGALNAAVASDVHVREQDAGIHFTVRIHPHIGREHAALHHAARHNASRGYDRI